MQTPPITLKTIAEELRSLSVSCRIVAGTLVVPISSGFSLWLNDVPTDLLDGVEPYIDISHHVESEGVHVSMAYVSGDLAALCAKVIRDSLRDGTPTQYVEAWAKRQNDLFSRLVDMRLAHASDPEKRGYANGLRDAFAILCDVDGEQLWESIEDAAQAAHDRMIAETELSEF